MRRDLIDPCPNEGDLIDPGARNEGDLIDPCPNEGDLIDPEPKHNEGDLIAQSRIQL